MNLTTVQLHKIFSAISCHRELTTLYHRKPAHDVVLHSFLGLAHIFGMTHALDLLYFYILSKNMEIKVYRKSNFACFTWEWNLFSTLREITEWGCLENRVLRGIFGLKGEEVIGCWRKLYNEELHDLYCWPDIIRVIKARGKDAVQEAQGLAGRCVRSRIQWKKDK